jgi:16S rRNA processing protein RimM
VIIRRYGDSAEVLARGAEIELRKGNRRERVTVNDARPYKANWLVSFAEAMSREEAASWAGAALFVDAGTLPPLEDGVYYEFEMIGLDVVTVDGEALGRVEEIVETGANDVIVVRGPKGEVLLPSLEAVVRKVDLEMGCITVDPPPGLLPETGGEEEKGGTPPVS